jgi:hypothetical protein
MNTMVPFPSPPIRNRAWLDRIFEGAAVNKGQVVRRAVRDVEREVGRPALVAEVRRRGFHLIECDGQFLIICNRCELQMIC